MIADNFTGLPAWTPPATLTQLGEPPHRVLAEFIHGCSQDDKTRTAATTALVLSLWQLQGIKLTPQVPSLLLVHPGEPADDPIDSFVKDLVYNEEDTKPRVQRQGPFMHMAVEQAPQSMMNAYLKRQQMGRELEGSPMRQLEARNAEERFHAASITAHGFGHSRPYAEAWHPDYGLLADEEGQIILRLNGDEDRKVFLDDLQHHPGKLVFPQGICPHLFPVGKSISLSGSVSLPQARTANEIVAYGQPLFLVPHLECDSLKVDNAPALQALAQTWRHAVIAPVATSPRLPTSEWTRTYRNALRKRLALLPYDHAFAIQQAIHQLDGICDRIVSFAGRMCGEVEELGALVRDIYGHALRGMVLSVAGLSWTGRGLYLGPECEPLREKAIKILTRLRSKGTVTTTELLKNFHMKKLERDALLQRLSEENLLRVEGSEVVATTYQEFVEGLYRREEFPPVVNEWEVLQQRLKVARE
ncbi:hypothetical protein HZ994_18215 [Akkermansiaceae bacterium]|nr:hypothetical protein HZ994_18215 [Akkermansiaceae bacterium]